MSLHVPIRPATSVDVIVLAMFGVELRFLCVERTQERSRWALPSAWLSAEHDAGVTALQLARAASGLRDIAVRALPACTAVERDPRERIIGLPFLCVARNNPSAAQFSHAEQLPHTEQAGLAWFAVNDPPRLVLDHAAMLASALDALSFSARVTTLPLQFLPEKFTLHQLHATYQALLRRSLDDRNFRSKIKRLHLV